MQFIFLILCFIPAFASTDWELVSKSDEVTLYRKEVPGSSVLAYKAEGKIEAPLAKIMSVVRDTARLPEWTYRVKHAEILEETSPNERIEYIQGSAPWPVKNRDVVVKRTFTYAAAEQLIRMCMESIEDARRPEASERVRAHIYPSCFVFKPERLTTRIEAELHGDPKGSIPKWIVNMIQKRAPGVSLRNLKKRVATPGIADDAQTLKMLAGKP
jgi:hypothetical protein